MGTITILSETTKFPIKLIGHRAGTCWGAAINSAEKNFCRGLDCLNSNHGRTFEFIDVHMIIDGYSARVMREYERHVGGLTPWLQASTRYIDYKNFDSIVPHTIERDGQAKVVFNQTLRHIREGLEELREMGIPKEDVANLLPLGMTTKIVEKRNLRNLIDMSHTRECTRAYWEFRELFNDIKKALSEYSPEWKVIVDNYFKPKCEITGYCEETKSCGRRPKGDNK